MSHRQSILFNGATIEGTIVEREGLNFFVEEVKPLDSETSAILGRKCGVCNRWYTTMSKLRKHHKVHQHPIHCCQASCQFKAAEFKDVFRHIKTNHSSLVKGLVEYDPVECNECGKKYSREDHYRRHKVQGHCQPRTDNFKSPLERIVETSEADQAINAAGNRTTSIDLTQSFDRLRSNSLSRSNPASQGVVVEEGGIKSSSVTKFPVPRSESQDQDSDDSSDGEVVVQPGPAKRTRYGRMKDLDDPMSWGHSTEGMVEARGDNNAGPTQSLGGGFSSTVLHIPDSTEAMLTAVNRSPDGTYSRQSVTTKEIDIEVPANTMVKLKVNLIVKR